VTTEGGRPARPRASTQRFPRRDTGVNLCELHGLKKLAKHYLSYSDEQIETALAQMELREIACDDQKEG